MIIWKILLIFIGLLATGTAFWGSYRFRSPYDTLISLLAPVGLILALIGIIVLCVPSFFSG